MKLYIGKDAQDLDPAHSQRIMAQEWQNGARIEVLLYDEPQQGEVESDRIHLLVTDQSGERRGWLMNREDAGAAAYMLNYASQIAERKGIAYNG